MNKDILNNVTVVTVLYNSAHCALDMKKSVGGLVNIIFSDNGSSDGGVSVYSKVFPTARIIDLKENLGYGAANNRALSEVNTKYALLLNPDCEINEESIIQLVSTAETFQDAAIIAPQVYKTNNTPEVNYRWPRFTWVSRGGKFDGPACVGFICGAAMLLNMEKFNGKFFDEEYFLYYEDDDLCTRIFKEKKSLIVDPKSSAIHKSRGSVKGNSAVKSEFIRGFHHAQCKIIYIKKNVSSSEARKLKHKTLILSLILLPIRIAIYNPRLIGRLVGRIIGLLKLKV